METLKFKTTIKCAGCVENVTPFLNATAGQDNWEVDVQHPQKTLTITTNGTVSSKEIVKAVEQAGFKAEQL